MCNRLGLSVEYDERIYACRCSYPVKSFLPVQNSETTRRMQIYITANTGQAESQQSQ